MDPGLNAPGPPGNRGLVAGNGLLGEVNPLKPGSGAMKGA